jgi:hypothetical protein
LAVGTLWVINCLLFVLILFFIGIFHFHWYLSEILIDQKLSIFKFINLLFFCYYIKDFFLPILVSL